MVKPRIPCIQHAFSSGRVVTQKMFCLHDARDELAHIVRTFRGWKHRVDRAGHQAFCVTAPDHSWSKSVGIVWVTESALVRVAA